LGSWRRGALGMGSALTIPASEGNFSNGKVKKLNLALFMT
jgi:hypothetical protein